MGIVYKPDSTGSADPNVDQPLIHHFLDTVGDDSGTINFIGDYSTPTYAKISPAAGEVFIIERLIVSVEDGVSMKAENYGGLPPLSTGITVHVGNVGAARTDYMLTDPGLKITTNAKWGAYAFDVDIKSWGSGPTNELLVCRWTFGKAGRVIQLVGDNSDELIITLSDNFTGLIGQHFLVQGYQLV